MTDLSPERLEKLLEDFAAAPMAPELHSKLHQLAPDLARQRIADAKRIAELAEGLSTAIGLLWDHCEGIAPRIETLETVLEPLP